MALPGLTQHRKFARLARALDSEAMALGCLEFMWSGCYESGDDYLGDELDVELAAHWTGEPGKLFRALLAAGGEGNSGFIDELDDRPGHYRVHDLSDHSPEYVQKRMVRELARKQRGVTISDLRRDAARKSHEARPRTPANVVQAAANGGQLQPFAPEVMQTAANGDTPAPAPAPALPVSQNQSQTPCEASARNADASRGDGGNSEVPTSPPEPDPSHVKDTPATLPGMEIPPEPAGPSNGKGKNLSTRTKPKPEKQTDSRYAPMRELLTAAFHKVCSATEPPPWGVHAAKELTDWLKNNPLKLPDIAKLVDNVTKSERAERLLRMPQRLIPNLREYNVPRDRFGDGPQGNERRSSASVGTHQPTPPAPADEWLAPEPYDAENGRKLWEKLKDEVRPRVDGFTFDLWLRPTLALGLGKTTGTLYVKLPVKDFVPNLGKFAGALHEVSPDRAIKFILPTLRNPEVSHAS